MQTIKMKNSMIIPVFNFLKKIELKNVASRGRNKFLKKLEDKNKEFQKDLDDVRKEYFKVDKQDNLLSEEDRYIYKDGVTEEGKQEMVNKIAEIEKEQFVISFTEYSKKFNALFTALEELDLALSGDDAIIYDELMDAYEQSEEEE